METELKELMAEVFFIEATSINKDSSPETIVQWDSINHLNLIVAIEEKFNITFTDEQITEMLNFGLILEVTKQALEGK
jgi:acyl carrier protein